MSANLHGEWDAYQKLDQLGDPWAALNQLVDFEAFRDILEECWDPAEAESAKGGRPPYDAVMMFKLLLVGLKCGLSDEKLEVLALDSLRVLRFLGVSMGDAIPDRATIARYRSQLDENTIRGLFEAVQRPARYPWLRRQRWPDDRCVVHAGTDSAEYTG